MFGVTVLVGVSAGARGSVASPQHAGQYLTMGCSTRGRSRTGGGTRWLHDAIGRAYPHRAGRKIQTVSTLVVELMAQGWVAGEKRGGTRWVYRPAVSRGEGLCQLAQWVIGDFMREPDERLYLIREGLPMVGFVPVGSPEALVENAGRQTKSACGPVGFR